MKKVLATVAGLVAFALAGASCSAVDTKETTSTTPIAVSTVKPVKIQDELRELRNSRGAARPEAKPTTKVTQKVTKPTVKPKSKVIKPKAKVVKKVSKKIVKPKKVYKKKTNPAKKKVTKKTKSTKVKVSGIAACIAKYESGGNPRAQNPSSSASGLYQFIDGTWNNFGGYSRAMYAPVSVQTQKFYIVWNGGKGAGNWVVAHKCGY